MGNEQARLPELIAFDLDYTLWPAWVDTHVSPPLKRRGEELNQVYDRRGQSLAFYPDVPSILLAIKGKVHIAACSRTHTPDIARQALDQLLIGAQADVRSKKAAESRSTKPREVAIPAAKFFDSMEIYPGSKITHFRRIHEKTGIPYNQMVFYDDENRNSEVNRLGVHFVLVPKGLNQMAFEKGLEDWRHRNP